MLKFNTIHTKRHVIIQYTSTGQDSISLSLSQESQDSIITQLLAAIESRCNTLAKSIINELEHRLLQRTHASRFATVLSSAILLNCIERMTGLYQSLQPTNSLWHQGPHFAALLTTLLHIRNLPPQTAITSQGRLIVAPDQISQPLMVHRSVKSQLDEQTNLPAAWLNPIGLKESALRRLRDEELPTGPEVREWDMRFVARLLLPEEKSS